MIHFLRNASVRVKLIGTNAIHLLLLLCMSGGFAYLFVSQLFLERVETSIRQASHMVAGNMEFAGEMAVRSFLKAQAETNLEIVETLYSESLRSGQGMEEARQKAIRLMINQRVGQSGYVFCLDASGRPVFHPRLWQPGAPGAPGAQGDEDEQESITRRMVKTGNGYFEYDWKNTGDAVSRPKAAYVVKFRPWGWFIGVSGYRDEFSSLVTMADLKGSLSSVALSPGGLTFLIGDDGSLLLGNASDSASQSELRSVYQMFVTEMMRKKSGRIEYQWKDPGSSGFRQRLIVFEELPRFNWIVGTSGYVDAIYAPVRQVKYWVVGIFGLFLVVIVGVAHATGMAIVRPMSELTECFRRGAKGDYSVRSQRASRDEIGTMGRYFNEFMERLQLQTDHMERTVEERTRELAHLNNEYLREIDQKNIAEQKLRQQVAFLDALLSAIPSPVFYRGADGHFLGCNKSYARDVLGTDPESVEDKTIRDFGVTYPHELSSSIMKSDARLIRTGGRMRDELVLRCADGLHHDFVVDKTVFHDVDGNPAGIIGVLVDITERRKVERDRELLERAVERASSAIFITEEDFGLIRYVNNAFEEDSGVGREEVVGKRFRDFAGLLYREQDIVATILESVKSKNVWAGRLTALRKDGGVYEAELSVSVIRDEYGMARWLVGVQNDISERGIMEAKLLQAQKLESIGLLAAGIAHEINTPAQFVGDNLRFIHDSADTLLSLVGDCCAMVDRAGAPARDMENFLSSWRKKADEEGVDFLKEELPNAIAQSLEGMARISTIVRAMKEFSHPGRKEKQLANLNDALRNTLTVTRNEWKYVADVVLDLDESLPEVRCLLTEMNQVFMNIIINAAHAITEKLSREHVNRDSSTGVLSVSGQKGIIHISSGVKDGKIYIRISDSGTGIMAEHQRMIFDPFFTTKEVGKGTGQGLAIARDVVTNKHGGTLDVESEPGKGATFIITLPVERE
ncbi:MAG: cache domain-containing protein [Halodesulfovibrio sp.]